MPESLRPATLLKKRLWHVSSPINFAKFLRTPFLYNTADLHPSETRFTVCKK